MTQRRSGETEKQRLNRNFNELLQELRVAQTGVQILFAFLLILPFSARFDQTTSVQRGLYVVTLTAAAVATATLIAPVSYHRLVFRRGLKEQVVLTSSRLAQVGLAALLIAVLGSVLLVLDVVAGLPWAAWLTAALAGFYLYLWYVIPALGRRRIGQKGDVMSSHGLGGRQGPDDYAGEADAARDRDAKGVPVREEDDARPVRENEDVERLTREPEAAESDR